MYYIGICDGQNDITSDSEGLSQQRLQVYNIGRAIHTLFSIHAVIGGGGDESTAVEQSADFNIYLAVKFNCLVAARGMLVLHVVRQRQIQQISQTMMH